MTFDLRQLSVIIISIMADSPKLGLNRLTKNVISNRPRDIAKIYTMLANNMKMSYAYNCIYNCIYIINIHHLIPDHCIRFYCFPIFSLLGFVASRGSGEVPSTMCLSWDLDDFLVKLGKIWLFCSLGTWILYFLNYAWVFLYVYIM